VQIQLANEAESANSGRFESGGVRPLALYLSKARAGAPGFGGLKAPARSIDEEGVMVD
jgi:hypothetical protein